MKKKFYLFKSILLLLLLVIVQSNLFAQTEYSSGKLRVKFNPKQAAFLSTMTVSQNSNGAARTGIPSVDRLNEQNRATQLKRVFPYAGKYEKKHIKHGLHLWYEIDIDKSVNVSRAAQQYNSLNEVSVAEPVYKKERISYEVVNGPRSRNSLSETVNDPRYGEQWHYNNTGQSGGTPDADIDLPEAWSIETGDPTIIVSVHDGGIDIDHEDIAQNMWVNPGEIAGNDIDDDNNGFVDDVYGFNFVDQNGTIDADGHGTHVGGTVAAETNNGVGMAGVAGGTGNGDGIRLMSCEVFSPSSAGGFENSYIYAADNGSTISQNSWGYTQPGNYEQVVMDAIDYFIAEAGYDENGIQNGPMAGGLVIFAAGNSASNQEHWPGYYDKIMAVAGTDHNDNKYLSSNFGPWVDIAAPGNNVLSTTPNNTYSEYSGTSMACPHVSGVAALILSKFREDGISPQTVWDRLVNTTEPLTFPGAENWGSGRLNAYKAIATNDKTPPNPINDFAVVETGSVAATLSWTAPADLPNNIAANRYNLRYSNEEITEENFSSATQINIKSPGEPGTSENVSISGLSPNTTYYLAIKSSDFFGQISTLSNVVQFTTLGAPEIVVSGDPSVAIDLLSNPVGTGTFTIGNTGAFDLKYNVLPIYKGRNVSTSSLIYPGTEVSITPAQAGLEAASFSATPHLATNGVQRSFESDFTQTILYDNGDDASDGIIRVTAGGDPTPWAVASALVVPESSNDFILTHVSSFLSAGTGAPAKPTTLSILLGGDNPDTGELLLAQEIQNKEGDKIISTALEMPIPLNAGDKVWVVYTFENVPMGIGYDEVTDGNRPGSYLAYFNGTWNDLQEQSGWENYVFISRLNKQEITGVSMSGGTGTILPGSSENVDITYDASKVSRNGDYDINVFIFSNDPVNLVKKLESTVSITGLPEPSIVVSPDSLNFTVDVSVSPKKTKRLTIQNIGSGEMKFDFNNRVLETSISASLDYPKGSGIASLGLAPNVSAQSAPAPSNPIKLSDITAYAHEAYPNTAFVSFSTLDPSSYLSNMPVTYTTFAGDFGASDFTKMYIIDNDAATLNTIDISTGNIQTIGSSLSFTDLACNKQTGVMYAVNYDNPTSSLHTVDLQTGAATKIGDIGNGIYISIACDGDGKLWALNLNDEIHQIDPATGIGTLVGNSGFDANYAQSMAWDPVNDVVYLSAYNDGIGRGELRILNRQTGATELVDELPNNAEVVSLGFPGGGNSTDLLTTIPSKGSIPANSSISIDVTVDASYLKNGSYESKLKLYSNDLDNPEVNVPVDIVVSGQHGVAELSSNFLEFGAVFVNGMKEMPITIYNSGIGDLEISSIESSLPEFSVNPSESLIIEDSVVVMVKFQSNTIISASGTLTLRTNDPVKPEIIVNLAANAIAPPVMLLNPTEIALSLDAGDMTTKTINMRNLGGYPLTYSFPEISANLLLSNPDIEKNNTQRIEGFVELNGLDKEKLDMRKGHPVVLGAGGPDLFGYKWIDSDEDGGPIYVWNDISATGTEILPSNDDGSIDVDLPFSFMFYDKAHSKINIGSNGLLTFSGPATSYANYQIPETSEPNNMIAPYWDDLRPSSKLGQIFYKSEADKFIVQYEKVGNYPSDETGTITFQAVLHANGTIEFIYKEISLANSGSATIGIENEEGTNGLQVAFNTDFITSEKSILFFKGRLPFDVSATPTHGVIHPYQQENISLTIDATDLIDGKYLNELLISTNDPLNLSSIITTKLDVTGYPQISTISDTINFGAIFNGLTNDKEITLYNVGSKTLSIDNIESSDPAFKVNFTEAASLKAGDSTTVLVQFAPTQVGLVSAELKVSSNDAFGNAISHIALEGESLEPPVLSVKTNPSPADISLKTGEVDTLTVTVSNTGGSELNYMFIPATYSSDKKSVETKQPKEPVENFEKTDVDNRVGPAVKYGVATTSSFGYEWSDNIHDNSVNYEWIEISLTGSNLLLAYDEAKLVQLPFSFPFYNETHTEVYVAANGYLSFEEDMGFIGGFINQQIPDITTPNNLIAPLWDDLEPQSGDGVFIQSFGNYVVVQYQNVPAFLGSTFTTFQVILYNNGDIKYQYKDVDDFSAKKLCTVGIENETGEDAVSIVFNNSYLQNELAVKINAPFISGTLGSGDSVNIDLGINTMYQKGPISIERIEGIYTGDILVNSNAPVIPSVSIPSTLTIIGTPELSIEPDSLLQVNIVLYEGSDSSSKSTVKLINSGTKEVIIDSVYLVTEAEGFTLTDDVGSVLDANQVGNADIRFTAMELGLFHAELVVESNDPNNPFITLPIVVNVTNPPVFAAYPNDTIFFELLSQEVASKEIFVRNEGKDELYYTAETHIADSLEYPSSANKWLTISPMSASLLENDSIAHTVTIDASLNKGGKSQGMVQFNTNDPLNTQVVVPVTINVNRLPEIVQGPPALIELNEGESTSFEIVVNDPDGDELLFDLINNQFTEISTEEAIVVSHTPGFEDAGYYTYAVEVIDEKGEGISINWTVIVKNVNRTPIVIADIDAKLYIETDPVDAIDLTAHFTDPDGDTLSYFAFGSNDEVMELEVEDNTLFVTPKEVGFDVATVVASDSAGLHAAISFNVRVRNRLNHAPILTQALNNVILLPEMPSTSIDLNDYFMDIDYDEISYTFTMSGTASAIVSQVGSVLTFTPWQSGMAVLTIYANDGRGGITASTLGVLVVGNMNGLPFLSSMLGNRSYFATDSKESIDLNAVFGDPDRDKLSYVAEVESGEAVEVAIVNNTLEITPLKIGESVIVVYASDDVSGIATTRFTAKVCESSSVSASLSSSSAINNYPNPASSFTTFELNLEHPGNVRLELNAVTGSKIATIIDNVNIQGEYSVDYAVDALPAGVYLYRLYINDKSVSTQKLIVE